MNVVLLGAGRMGAEVAAAAQAEGHEVTARLGRSDLQGPSEGLARRMTGADVAIDFTVAEQVPRSVHAAALAGVDLVVGTTGWLEGDVDFGPVRDAGHGVVHGANFSIGVHVFLRLVTEAGRLAGMAGRYDVRVDEIHHRHKRDHPSGTAIRVAEALLGQMDAKERWVAGPPDGPADPAVLYVGSARAGEVPGTHVVGLEGLDDRIEVRHEARNRAAFARGAIHAAEWIQGRAGIHTFEEVVTDLLGPTGAEATGEGSS